MGKGQDLYRHAKTLIPGGTQLLSKRPEQFLPEQWPAYYSRAKGCEVWDLDGNRYVDMSYMAIGACTIGYADDDVDDAVREAIAAGSITTLNCPVEVELAELLVEIHPWANMVRYARCGGEAMAIAVRIARAATQRDKVLFCGYHGWNDWYLAANLSDDQALDGQLLPGLKPRGVPRGLAGTAISFSYNKTDEFLSKLRANKGEIGAVVIEPVRNMEPESGFLETIRAETRAAGIPLVIDEVSSGWRLNCGGAHLVYQIEPDLAVFAKGMSNGYAMGAIIGKAEFMDAAQESFISSTYWTEGLGPAAAVATIRKMRRLDVPSHLIKAGQAIQAGWKRLASRHDIELEVGSIYPLSHFDFVQGDKMALKTLFIQEMLKRGFLASLSFYASYAHTDADIEAYLSACDEVFSVIKKGTQSGTLSALLAGPVCQSGFKRLN